MLIKKLFQKYKELISYVFWGVATTLVNLGVYFLCTRMQMHHLAADIMAWVVSVTFAFLANKLFVFHPTGWKTTTILLESCRFYSSRLFSGALEFAGLWLFVDLLHFPDGIIKIIMNVLVVIINYLLSKLFVFRARKEAIGA